MTHEERMILINYILQEVKNDNLPAITKAAETLKKEIQADITATHAKTHRLQKPLKLAQKILKNVDTARYPALQYPHTLKDGRQAVCDGFRLLIMSEPLQLPEMPADLTPIDIDNIIVYNSKQPERNYLELPDLQALKSYIKYKKAAKQKNIIFDFGEGFPVVNAEWLADAIEATGATSATNAGVFAPLWFRTENIEYMLLPVRPEKDKTRTRTNLTI